MKEQVTVQRIFLVVFGCRCIANYLVIVRCYSDPLSWLKCNFILVNEVHLLVAF